MIVRGSEGNLRIDETGKVVILFRTDPSFPEPPGYTDIERFDLDEFKAHYGRLHDEYDILDLGYWTKDGKYEPPDHEWREDVAEMRADAEREARE